MPLSAALNDPKIALNGTPVAVRCDSCALILPRADYMASPKSFYELFGPLSLRQLSQNLPTEQCCQITRDSAKTAAF